MNRPLPLLTLRCPPPPLILSRCIERSLGSVGGDVDSRLAHGLVGHDSGGELGLSLLKAGVSLPVEAVDLKRRRVQRADIYDIQSKGRAARHDGPDQLSVYLIIYIIIIMWKIKKCCF